MLSKQLTPELNTTRKDKLTRIFSNGQHHPAPERGRAEDPVDSRMGQGEVQRAIRGLDAVDRGHLPQVLHQG